MGRIIKIALSTAYFAGGAYLGYTEHYIFMTILLVLGSIMTYSIIRHGSVALAMKALEKQDNEKARKYLNETFNVKWLSSAYKAFYYMVDGYILTAGGLRNEAIVSYELALQHKIKRDEDKAIMLFQLSMLYADKGNIAKSRILLKSSKDLEPKGQLLDQIKKFEKRIR
jgi:hypothetical protein